jgi:DNA-binding beta-propeller fold protein YncE
LARIVAALVTLLGLLALAPPAARAAGARLFKSGPVQVTADGRFVWVANADQDSVTRVDATTLATQEFPLPAGTRHLPRGLSVSEDGSEVWVACHDSDQVLVLSGADGSVLAAIPTGWGSGPYSVALSRDQSRALVTLHRAEALVLVDVASRAVAHRLAPVYWSPLGIAWMEDGVSAWVTHLFADGEDPFLTRVDVSGPVPKVTTKLIVKSTTPKQSSRLTAPQDVAEGGYLTFRGHLAQIPSVTGRNRAWIPTQYNNINEDVFTPDSTIQSTIRTLDLGSHLIPNTNADKVILSAVHVHDPAGSNPYVGPGWNAGVSGPVDVAFSADGATAWVLFEQSNDLVVMPTTTGATKPATAPPLTEIPTGYRPLGVAVSPVRDVASDLSVIDLATNAPLSRVALTAAPAIADPGMLNGARLFHSSVDPAGPGSSRLSSNEKVACASCHPHGEHDGRTWDFEHLPGSHGPRSTMSLLGLSQGFAPGQVGGRGSLHRSGDRDEVQDFDHTFMGVNMGGTGILGGAANAELGAPNAGRSGDLDDLASYLLSLPPIARSPHRRADGSLSEAAVRGATFFVGSNLAARPADANCASCHVPETGLQDGAFHDVGQRRPASENELQAFNWQVATPTLLGVWTSPPYDGVSSWASSLLGVVIDQRGRATHGRTSGLTGRQLRDLAELVLSLDGNTTAAELRGARDVDPPRVVRVSPTSTTRIEVWLSESVDPSAAQPSAWRVTRAGGADVPVTGATWDGQNGDRITLTVNALQRDCLPVQYVVQPLGPIADMADRASGGVANLLDVTDAGNAQSFLLGPTLTITMGASGYENVTIPVHDAAVVGPGLPSWSHGSLWLGINANGQSQTGFVRFDWAAAFRAATGVASSADIASASFALHPEWGDLQDVEARRVLKSWADGGNGDWASNTLGSPTWSNVGTGRPWGTANAMATMPGVDGASASDYNGAADVASQPDAVVAMTAINVPFDIAGPGITSAYRFWFDNPTLDYGHALRVRSRGSHYHEAKFANGQFELRQDAPVLTITYDVPAGPVTAPSEVSAPASGVPLLARVAAPGTITLAFEDLRSQATVFSAYEGRIGLLAGSTSDFYSHAGIACASAFVPTARGLELSVPDPAVATGERGRYWLVTAAHDCAEGPSGADSRGGAHPSARLDCAP